MTITQPTRVVGSLSTAVLQVRICYLGEDPKILNPDITLNISFGKDIIGRRRCLLLCRCSKSHDYDDDGADDGEDVDDDASDFTLCQVCCSGDDHENYD